MESDAAESDAQNATRRIMKRVGAAIDLDGFVVKIACRR
jgi:hypothetical protein